METAKGTDLPGLLEFNGHRARDSPAPRPAPQEEKPAFALPIPNQDQRRVFAYLQKRGIAPQVIRGFIESGLLYEDSQHHNCVFVGRDGSGKPVFASKRGTYDLGGSSFKRSISCPWWTIPVSSPQRTLFVMAGGTTCWT